jgi:hypothetical protein
VSADKVLREMQGTAETMRKRGYAADLLNAEVLDQWRTELTEALRVMRGWIPIESAPKDGRKVLLCHLANEPFIGRWHNPLGWVDQYSMRDPTHWQPLPPPPTKEPQA